MSDKKKDHPLGPRLSDAEKQLQSSLEEVCEDTDVPKRDTDELIRIEETLSAASETAKQAISLRRRIRSDD